MGKGHKLVSVSIKRSFNFSSTLIFGVSGLNRSNEVK